jgi:hypothetical protein
MEYLWGFAGNVVGGLWAASGSFSWSKSFVWDYVVGPVRGVRKWRPSTDTIAGVSDGGLDGSIGILSSRCNAAEAQFSRKVFISLGSSRGLFSTTAWQVHGVPKAQSFEAFCKSNSSRRKPVRQQGGSGGSCY